MASQQPFRFIGCLRPVNAAAMSLEKLLDNAIDAVGPLGAGLCFLFARVVAFGDEPQRFAAELAGGFQVDGGISAERELSRCAVVPVANRPAFGAGRRL